MCGELSVSRSIGDPDFKGFTAAAEEAGPEAAQGLPPDFPFDFPPGHSGLFHADLVIADPEIVESTITVKVRSLCFGGLIFCIHPYVYEESLFCGWIICHLLMA